MLKFFKQFPEIIAIISEKEDGSTKLADDGDIARKNMENRKAFFEKNGIEQENVVSADLMHGADVKIIPDVSGKIILQTDGLVTKEKNMFLAITVADCVPIFFYEKKNRIIALAHGGWRGIVENIAENAIGEIRELGGEIENIFVSLGPGINDCHFEIKKNVLENFSRYPEFVIKRNEKIFVDLKGIIKEQLSVLGIKNENIENNSICTYCSKALFSFRRDKTDPTKTMIAAIGKK